MNGQAYTWDNNGNLTSDGLLTYSYDQANRLKQVTQGANTYTFGYNGVGDRLSQTVGLTTTHYVLDPAAGLTQVLSDGTNTYLYGNGRIAQYQAEMQYFGADGLGSVRQLYDATGQVLANNRYDPYGTVLAQSGTATSVFGYTGEEWDAATGLEYLRARYYSSAQGRFTTEDTTPGNDTRPQSLHLYSYAWNNPINLVDPSGQQVAPPLVCAPGQPCPTGLLGLEQWNALKGCLMPKAPVAPDGTVEARKNLQAVIEDRKVYQALRDPTLISAFDTTRGQYEKRDALLELWFDIHCDYDPLYDHVIEAWAAAQGWDPYGTKLYIRTRWGWWKLKHKPGDLAGIQSLASGIAPLGGEQQIEMMTRGMALAGFTGLGRASSQFFEKHGVRTSDEFWQRLEEYAYSEQDAWNTYNRGAKYTAANGSKLRWDPRNGLTIVIGNDNAAVTAWDQGTHPGSNWTKGWVW